MKRKAIYSAILCLITIFLVGPVSVSALSPLEEKIELPRQDAVSILNSLNSEITRKQIKSLPLGDPEEEAIMALLSTEIKSSTFSYLMTQAPKEVLKKIIEIGAKMLIFNFGTPTILEVSVDEARKRVTEWLVRNELLITSGNLPLSSYRTYDNKIESLEFRYFIIHNPQTKEIKIVIYSPDKIKPPKSQGGFTRYTIHGGSFWNDTKWLEQGKTHISPFTVNIIGKIEKNRFRGYTWTEVNINVDFHSPVPKFELKSLSFMDRQILSLNKSLLAAKNGLEMLDNTANKIGEVGQNVWNRIKSGGSDIINLGGAAISPFLFSPKDDNTTVVSLQDETASFQKIVKKDDVNKDKEIEKLKKTIAKLENELKDTLQKRKEQPKEIVEPTIEIVDISKSVEINSAPISELTKIIHITPARAEEIIRLRPFSSLDDLIRISGIGKKRLADIKEEGIAYVEYKEDEEIKETDKKEDKKKDNPVKDPCLSGGVDINKASLADLTFLKGIGKTIAQRIIDHRKLSPFNSLDDLVLVSGIGPAKLKKIKDQGCAYVKTRSSTQRSATKERVEINSAPISELTKIIHITPARAEEIIRLRPFSSLDDLIRISGIGKKRLADIKEEGIAYVEYKEDEEIKKKPKIEIDKERISFNWEIGKDPPSDQFTIQNRGEIPATWTINNNEWLSFNASSGTIKAEEEVIITFSINSNLEIKEATTTTTTIEIESNCDNSPHKIDLLINILSSPTLAQNVVITEIKINEKEFVEIYNPTEEEVDITGWYLSYYSSQRDRDEPLRRWSFPESSIIPTSSYFLIGIYGYPEEGGSPSSDWELLTGDNSSYKSGQLNNRKGSLAIFDKDEYLIDAIGWGETTVKEGDPSEFPKKGESINRRKNSEGRYIDNGDNLTDFIITTPTPTNSKGERGNILPPEQITDLSVICGHGEATLSWTIPANPDTPQELLSYEIRYHKGTISEYNWTNGTVVQLAPSVATSTNEVIIKNLNYGTDYSFGLVALNTKNQSPLSNISWCKTDQPSNNPERLNLEGPVNIEKTN